MENEEQTQSVGGDDTEVTVDNKQSSVEMRNRTTDSPNPSKSKTSPTTKSMFKMFKSKKHLDVEPAPDYLTSRRDTLQNDRNWHRKYSAQWHDFVENELFNQPAELKTQSQLQLVENPAY